MSETKSPARPHLIRTIVTMVAAVDVTAVILWFHFSGPDTGKYAGVIERLTRNQLNADASGHVDLRNAFPGITPRDEMFLKRRADGTLLAMFPTLYGQGSSIGGLIYSSRALTETDTYTRLDLAEQGQHMIDVGVCGRLLIDRRLDEHWYAVSRGIH